MTLSIVRNDKMITIQLRRVSQESMTAAAQPESTTDALVDSALQNALRLALGANAAPSAPPVDSSPLAGEWHKIETDSYNTKETWLTLFGDGTYKKVFNARLFGFGQVVNEQTGQWYANGTLIQLSGDGNSPGSVENLLTFSRNR